MRFSTSRCIRVVKSPTEGILHFALVQHDVPGSLPAAGVVSSAPCLLSATCNLVKKHQMCLQTRLYSEHTLDIQTGQIKILSLNQPYNTT